MGQVLNEAEVAYVQAVVQGLQILDALAKTTLSSLLDGIGRSWPEDAREAMRQRVVEAEGFYQRARELAPHASARMAPVQEAFLAAAEALLLGSAIVEERRVEGEAPELADRVRELGEEVGHYARTTSDALAAVLSGARSERESDE